MTEVLEGPNAHGAVAGGDDDRREILKQTLHKCGCLVQTAVDGAEALELVKAQPVDLVLVP